MRIGKGAPEDEKCQELGIVYGSGSGGLGTSKESVLAGAQNQLRNRTAGLGGNFVIMDVSASDPNGVTLSGRALLCKQGHPQDARPIYAPADTEAATAPSTTPVPITAPTPSTEPERAASAPATKTPEQRIRALDDLHQKGLVTDSEYQAHRKEILDSL